MHGPSLPSSERWRENWRAVSPAGGVLLPVPRSRGERRISGRRVAALPAGTAVVLTSSAPGAIRRCRSFAAETGIALEHEYLALPSAAAPAYLVEDSPASVAVFLTSVLSAPPGLHLFGVTDFVLRLVRALNPWRLVRAAAPGRLVVGRCT